MADHRSDQTSGNGSDQQFDFGELVARVLEATEPGDVLTYGEVAEAAGRPGAARAVGTALRTSEGLPWWRVVTSTGRLVPGNEAEHGKRLVAEGAVIRNGRVIAGAAQSDQTPGAMQGDGEPNR